ncbi:MAG TPA: hypothetical protein VFN50_08540 [Acidimicrobiales bacterium]|nr:hypothetical protein [Acidimicrobiales bacterium]
MATRGALCPAALCEVGPSGSRRDTLPGPRWRPVRVSGDRLGRRRGVALAAVPAVSRGAPSLR